MAAVAAGRDNPATVFMPTGGLGRHPPEEAVVMTGLLRAAGVPDSRIWPEPTARDTLQSARACRRLLRARDFGGRVLACSSGYHLPRCVALLWLAGLRAGACRPPPKPPYRWYWRLREAAALPYDVVILLALRLLRRF